MRDFINSFLCLYFGIVLLSQYCLMLYDSLLHLPSDSHFCFGFNLAINAL